MRSGLLVAAIACVTLATGQAWSNSRTKDPMGIAVSPQTLILSQDQGGAVTVHTAIPYSDVDLTSLYLNGISAGGAWADNCGNLVARFSEAAIEALVAPPSAVLTLRGSLADGTPCAGSDTVRVIR